MVAHICCFAVNKPSAVRVSSVSHTGVGTTFWESIISIPAARLPTGHDLVFVCTGIVGNHRREVGSIPFVEVAPFFGTPPSFGTVQTFHTYRQLFEFGPYISTLGPPVVESNTGQPFFTMVRNASWPADTPFHLVATLQLARPINLVNPERGTFDVEGLAVHVWDLTELNAAGIAFEISESFSNFAIPDVNATPVTVNTLTRAHGSAVNWLTYFASNITPGNENAATQSWMDDGAGAEGFFAQRVGYFLHGLPTNFAWQRYPVGNMRAVTLPSTWTLRQRVRDNYAGGTRGNHFTSMLFAVQMPTDTYLQAASGSTATFWGTEDPWNGDPLVLRKTFPHHINGIVIGIVATGPITSRWRTLLEADGMPVNGNFPMAVLSRGNPFENLPQVRVATYGFQDAWLSWRGAQHWGEPTPVELTFQAADCFLLAFNGIPGVVPPAPIIEEPGPEVPLLASKETMVSVSALPALPFQPSYGTPVSVEGETRVTRIPAGYDITHPKFERARRTVRLTWQMLTAADGATLVAFARGLVTTNGAFRWQQVGDLAERPYAWVEATIPEGDLGHGGPVTFSMDAIELLFYVP